MARSEFAEMPGLHLSKRQAQRLWDLDSPTVETILETLEASHYLKRTADEMYVRADLNERRQIGRAHDPQR
jgi:hypothetical protein